MGKGKVPAHAFKGYGNGLKAGELPISIRFPAAVKAVLDSMSCDRQNFVRAAVLEKLEREGISIEPKS